MAASAALIPGAPGIYRDNAAPPHAFTGVRMDVCAFLGVAPRGPAREPVLDVIARNCLPDPRVVRQFRRTVPVAVESFDEYRQLYGGFEGPGLLPYAVGSFFEQGGRRAYIARIVHHYPSPGEDAQRVAEGTVGGANTSAGPLILRARHEGAWGNQLRASLQFRFTPLDLLPLASSEIIIPKDEPVPIGSLLRLTFQGGVQLLRFVTQLFEDRGGGPPQSAWRGILDLPVPQTPNRIELVTADLELSDGGLTTESFAGMGLAPEHPRWLGAALCYDSQLVYPHPSWLGASIRPKPDAAAASFQGGDDAYEAIEPEDFFDPGWTLGDDEPGDGVASLVGISDLALVVAPDLYSPGPLVPVQPISDPPSLAGPTFQYCAEGDFAPLSAAPRAADLDGLRLDPGTDLSAIQALQKALADFAEQQQSWIVLLDVPPGLTQRQILSWRSKFNTAYAAAYHPWLKVARGDDQRDSLIQVPPSAVAAGIIAQREIQFGVPYGPANELAVQVVTVTELVSPAQHAELHPLGVNVYLRDRDGIRLSAARTLSRDPAWRQLSVRRLITLLRRSLEQQMQWVVFEPNNRNLQRELALLLRSYLGQLFRLGAFRGANEQEAFFVRCDASNNPPSVLDAGRLIAEIGVAPAEPLEFIVIRLIRGGDGTLLLREA